MQDGSPVPWSAYDIHVVVSLSLFFIIIASAFDIHLVTSPSSFFITIVFSS